MSANCVFAIIQFCPVVTHSRRRFQTGSQLRIGFLQLHLLREIPTFLAEWIFHGPIATAPPEPEPAAPLPAFASNRCGASDTNASTHSAKVIGVTPSLPMRAVWPSASKCLGNAVHQFEIHARAGRDVRHRCRAQTALGRFSDDGLINLNRRQATIERVAFGDERRGLLFPFARGRP